MLFNTQDIVNNFDQRDNNRGRIYQTQGHVKDIHIEQDGAKIEADVQGSARQPYHVSVSVEKRFGIVQIESHCTCPVGYMCKHGAAALYEAIAHETRQHERIHVKGTALGKETATLSARIVEWVEQFEKKAESLTTPEEESRIVYNLVLNPATYGGVSVVPSVQHRLRDGQWSRKRTIMRTQLATMKRNAAGAMTEEDMALLEIMGQSNDFSAAIAWDIPDDVASLNYFIRRIVDTGRAFLDEACLLPLKNGPEIQGRLSWELMPDGQQRACIATSVAGLHTLKVKAPWYFAPHNGEVGPILCEESADLIGRFLKAPPVSENEARVLKKRLSRASQKIPAPFTVVKDKTKAAPPKAQIHVFSSIRAGNEKSEEVVNAFLIFDYEGTPVRPTEEAPTFAQQVGDQIHLRRRDEAAEEALLAKLQKLGLRLGTTDDSDALFHAGSRLTAVGEESPWFWHDFMHRTVGLLQMQGFKIDIASDVHATIIEPDDQEIDAAFTQKGDWWFSMDLGITIDGHRVPLLPILVAMIKKIKSTTDLDHLKTADKCYAPLPDGRMVALPAARIHMILKTLIELFEDKSLDENGQLRVSMDVTAAFLKLEAVTRKRWIGEGQLRKLVEKLGDFSGIQKQAMPKTLQATLRPYQTDGYNWLHFLGEYGLSGILADDMGLGKTVQALAYIQSRKDKGALDAPVLIVMPTSLIANWQSEAAKFTPSLKILTLHGKDRAKSFKHVKKYDLVLTTYPLLPRDKDDLCEMNWSLIILDEAQAIKNPGAKVTQAVCELQAKQRLCLTGTPVENHLGEGWSIFTFLMPGLLGNHKSFTKLYRSPIEKDGDADRKDLLVRRLRPFVLRRLKTEVAKELPPKTEIIRRVTLTDEQRDLYETVRHVMNDRVRDEIAAKGLARSQIVILDALLKLRQTCCDPRLVKLEAAAHVASSAKLDELKEMLPTLIEEGRKILLFSQFTSMLDLIKKAVTGLGIPFVELRGTTKDRVTPIKQFQEGEVPLFLISLKAGGTGLNLTAADTVIHYDPWWNPSVENQATDRAHRIGQDKPVFVYKLIAENTVEEKILELQTRKAELAAALFGDKPAAAASLTQDDIRWLMGEE